MSGSFEALCRRFTEENQKKEALKLKLARYEAGCKGEASVDYPLSLLPEKEFLILHNLRLHEGEHYFQIDCLILTAQFFLILEIKHIAGVNTFNTRLHQLVRTIGGNVQRFSYPFAQTANLTIHFHEWLETHKWPNVPIKKLVVLSSPRAIIETEQADAKFFEAICFIEWLPHKIRELIAAYPQQLFSYSRLKSISRRLCKADEPLMQDVLSVYQVTPDQIFRGVQCPSCQMFGMERQKAKWVCPACKCPSKDAHLSALKDYALLFGSSMTNRQCRDFLKLGSRSIAQKMLKSLQIPSTGLNKGTIYQLPFDD